MNSLQSRLIWGACLVIGCGMLSAAILVYALFQSALYAEVDAGLRSRLQSFASLTEATELGIELEFTELGLEEFQRTEQPSCFQVWVNGVVGMRSSNLGTTDLKRRGGSLEQPDYTFVALPNGYRGRQISATFHPRIDLNDQDLDDEYFDDEDDGGDDDAPDAQHRDFLRYSREVTIAIASDLSTTDHRLATLGWILAGVGAAITASCLGLLAFVVRHGLRPLRAVSSSIEDIDATSLDQRVSVDAAPKEIAPIVARLNELLSRIEDAFHRERAFSSNLAHELRTPLAGLRSTIEVYLSRPHQPDEYQEALQTCLTICHQSQVLVENLLALSRLERAESIEQTQEVEVDELFQECWQEVAERAASKRLHTKFEITDGLQLTTEREKLRVILRNLVGNAVSHSDVNGHVNFSATNGRDSLKIQVSNSGNRLSREQVAHVFDRLWRGDSARAETGEHFGLGLTLIRRLTEALGGDVTANVDEDIFRVRLVLPLTPAG